ncbi:MAG: SDR family NAD(P)-dependent oxidoreductase, partial [Candidatus Aminicenantes bacterium]|nr:SDR family NAD(P)-dependent oxidoreductase [Candidatus Aminicenantes bacterium]
MISLRDKVVFITGASSGIGRSCARVFAREGAKILMAARRLDRLK